MYKRDLGGIERSHLLQPQGRSHAHSSSCVLSPYLVSNCEQPPHCTVLDHKACHLMEEGISGLTSPHPEIEAQLLQADNHIPAIDSLRFSATSLPPLHVINSLEAGQLTAASDLLARLAMNIIARQLGSSGHPALLCREIAQACRQREPIYMFDHRSSEYPASEMREPESGQAELITLKQTLSDMQQQFSAQLKQRDIEKKLLSRALTVAKRRLDDQRETSGPIKPAQPSSTLGAHLREEIAAMRLQPAQILESVKTTPLPAQQMLNELQRTQDEMQQKLEQSEDSRKRLEEEIAHLSHERSDLESSLQALRSQLNGDRSIEQMQIASLQQSLEETQEALEQANAAREDQEQKLQAALHETTSDTERAATAYQDEIERLQKALAESEARLSQAQADQQQWESSLRETLEKADQAIDQNRAEHKAEITTLQQQLQTQESSRRQLAQEKAELSNSLHDETQRALEFATQAQALDENSRNLKREFEALQQAFSEAKTQHQNDAARLMSELDQSRLTIEELGQSRQQLEATRAELAQAQRELALSESSLQAAMEEAELSAKARQETYEGSIDSLQQQIQSQESSLLQLAQEKAELASRLNTESERAMEFAGQAESLEARNRNLEQALETAEQAFSETQAQHQREAALLNEELGSARDTIETLERALQQTQEEFKAEQTRLNQALETQQQDAGRTESHLKNQVKHLSKQVESIRVKAIRQRKKRIRLETMLAQEQKASEQLKQLMQANEEETELAQARLAEAEGNQQELQAELEKEIKSSQAAWEKVSETDVALQVTKLELTSCRDELDQEVDSLRAQLEHLEETRATIQNRHDEEKNRLAQSLEQSETALKVAQVTIRTLKSDRQSIRDAHSDLNDRFAELESASQKEQLELSNALETCRQELASLRQELAELNALGGSTESLRQLRQELQRTNDEKAELKRKIDGLRVVQLEMERHQGSDQDAEVAELQAALIAAEEKCKKAETLAQEAETLRRERQVQEVAIETLTEDLDALSKENAALIDERDRLQRVLPSQSTDDA